MTDRWTIQAVLGREILDSRGNPTVEAAVTLANGVTGRAAVPSGASTGQHEAHELRDGDTRYGGKGVLQAVAHVNGALADLLRGQCVLEQAALDRAMILRDGTPDKHRLGANAILSVSLAAARAAAKALGLPLYRYLGGAGTARLPLPMMNILNGGAHAANNVEIQEFMVVPVGAANFQAGLQMCAELFHALRAELAERGTPAAGVGDEGGYAPNLPSDEAALDAILAAGIRAGREPGKDFRLALDCAVSDWYDPNTDQYVLPKSGTALTREALLARWTDYASRYPICSIEDGMAEDDWAGWQTLTAALGDRIQLVGDDLFVTHPERLRTGIHRGCANAILIKPNQIGTLTETLETISLAKSAGYAVVLSHRSGETTDPFLADLAVAADCGLLKAGAPSRGERVSKYNRLLAIEEELTAPAFGVSLPKWK